MKYLTLALGLTLGASATTLPAQQVMPGMDMPVPPRQPQSSSGPKPNRTKQRPDPTPKDLKNMGTDPGNSKAKAAAASEGNSVNQQAAQVRTQPSASSDPDSLTLPFDSIQEPEAVDLHTGSSLPAPELLRDVTQRSAMSLDHFLTLAEKGNPTLAQAQLDVERSRQQARQAGLPPDPTVGYSGDHIRGGSYHGGEEGAFLSQDFVLGRKLALRRNVYRAEGHANEFAVEVQRARIRDDVTRAFIHALAAQQAVTLQDRLLGVALDAQTNSHELERVGQADASAVLEAEVAAEQAKIEFEDAQRSFLAAFAHLASVAGQLTLSPQPLTGPLVEPPVIDPEALVADDVTESPAVKRAKAEVAVAEARLKSAKRESIPDLNIKAGEWYSGETLGATNVKAGPMSFAEAGVQLPLWNRNQGNVAAARTEVDRAGRNVSRVQLMTRNQAEPLAQQYATARASAERYRTAILPRARRAYQLEVLKYQQMAQIYPAVLRSQHMLFSLQLNYLHALDQEWSAALALQNYTLINSLEEPETTGTTATDLNRPTATP